MFKKPFNIYVYDTVNVPVSTTSTLFTKLHVFFRQQFRTLLYVKKWQIITRLSSYDVRRLTDILNVHRRRRYIFD